MDSSHNTYSDNLSNSTNELKQEFSLINKNIPNIEFEELNSLRRVCLVTARANSITCRLKIALPPMYPQNDCPTFTITDSNQYGSENLNKEAKEKLLNLLNETARAQLSRSRNCIEPCLRKFIATLQKMTTHGSHRTSATGSGVDYKDDPITLSAQRDHSIPFPQTSGAKFCGNLLVCFGRPLIPTVNLSTMDSGEETNWSVETPRSMAQMSAQLDNMRRQGAYNLSHISISYFYYGSMRRAELQSRSGKISTTARAGSKYLPNRGKSIHSAMSKNFKCGPVLIYDVSSLLGGLSRDLAENYIFDKDVIKMCRKNAEIAASFNRKDLVQIWSLAELSSEGVLNSYYPNKDDDQSPLSLLNHDSDFGDRPWTMHPFGSKLIQSLIDHYVYNCHDVQTAAMLVWTFSSPRLGKSIKIQNTKYTSNMTQPSTLQANSNQHPATGSKMNPLYSMISNYHTVIPGMLNSSNNKVLNSNNTQTIDTISGEWSFVNGPETHLYSNSWSNSTIHENLAHVSHQSSDQSYKNDNRFCTDKDCLDGTCDTIVRATSDNFPKLNILSAERSLQNDLIMHVYADLLYRLNLLNQRAMVLKNVGSDSIYSKLLGEKQNSNDLEEDRLPNITIQCSKTDCQNKCHSYQCPACKKYSFYCSICRLPVRGSCSICSKCLHGGHVNHFKTWFSSYDYCPTGCGCKCLSIEHSGPCVELST